MLKYLNGETDDFARYAAHLNELWQNLPAALRYIQREMVGWSNITALREQPSLWISLHDAEIEKFSYDLVGRMVCLGCIADDHGDAIPVTLYFHNARDIDGDLSGRVGQTILYHEVDTAPTNGWTHRIELSSGSCISLTFDDVSLTFGLP